nr:hypothetical protein [uncultured Sphingomonas sp.]
MGYRGHFSTDGSVGWEDRWVNMSRTERLVFVGGILNFFALVAISIWVGGDAVQGKVENGRYFVAEEGRYHEVSATFYRLNQLHVASIFLTLPLAGLMAWSGEQRARRKLKGKD